MIKCVAISELPFVQHSAGGLTNCDFSLKLLLSVNRLHRCVQLLQSLQVLIVSSMCSSGNAMQYQRFCFCSAVLCGQATVHVVQRMVRGACCIRDGPPPSRSWYGMLSVNQLAGCSLACGPPCVLLRLYGTCFQGYLGLVARHCECRYRWVPYCGS